MGGNKTKKRESHRRVAAKRKLRKRTPKPSTAYDESRPLPSPEAAVITEHALERFVERSAMLTPDQPMSNPTRTLRTLMKQAYEEVSGGLHQVERSRRHGTEARFFVAHGWRMVVVEKDEEVTVVTVERVDRTQNG